MGRSPISAAVSEPASIIRWRRRFYGIPVLFGPRFQKFKEARDLIKVGGGFSVASKDEFVAKMDELLTYAEVLKAAGESAGQFVKGNAGATDGILKELAL